MMTHFKRFLACTTWGLICFTMIAPDIAGAQKFRRRMTNVTQPAGAPYKADPRDEIKFESQARSDAYIHIENGPIVVAPIKEDAWSARWHLEPVGEGNYVRIKNKWTGCYLNLEKGPLVCGPKDNGWWSAQWEVLHESDVKYFIINRWTGCRLVKEENHTNCIKGDKPTAENLWRPASLTNFALQDREAAQAAQAEADRQAEAERQAAAQREQEAQRQAEVERQAEAQREQAALRQADEDRRNAKQNRRQAIIDSGQCAARLSTDDGDSNPFAIIRSHVAGKTWCANETAVSYVGNFWNDNIEMVSITSPYVKMTAYLDANFQGRSISLTCGWYELIDDPENEISSYKIEILDAPVACRSGSKTELRRWD